MDSARNPPSRRFPPQGPTPIRSRAYCWDCRAPSMLLSRCARRRAVGAEAKRAEGDLEIVDKNEEIASRRERGVGAQRRQRGAAAVHEGRGLEDAHGHTGHRAFRRPRRSARRKGGRFSAERRRRPGESRHWWRVAAYSGTWISQAGRRRATTTLLLALGLLLGLRGLALLFGGRSGCGLASGALLILADLADELGLGDFGRGFGRRRGDFFGARAAHVAIVRSAPSG